MSDHASRMGLTSCAILLLAAAPVCSQTTRYTITAKGDDATDQALQKLSAQDFLAEKDHMLQVMLADRFKLRLHPATRISTVYHLIATARAAHLLLPVKPEEAAWRRCLPSFATQGVFIINSEGCPTSTLVGLLQSFTPDPIIDQTGLSQQYAFHLQWRLGKSAADAEEEFSNMRDAVHEQLGLELKSAKGPVTFYVIDHLEEPSPN